MKRSSRVNTGILSLSFLLAAGTFGLSAAPYVARAEQGTVDPNQLLAFKRIFVEPVQDNVDGAFRAPVEQSFREVFDRNPRFELVDDVKQADTVLRTVITKKAAALELEITLALAATGEVFTHERESIASTTGGRETGSRVKQLLKAALKRIPFYGTVTGRDGKELTFDIGSAHGLRARDIVQISRIDNVKRHPLLKSIVDVQLVPVGNAVVDSVEESIAFGHVQDQITGESVQKLHKVTAIEGRLPDPVAKKPVAENAESVPAYFEDTEPAAKDAGNGRPQIGYVGLGLGLSGFSNTTSSGTNGTSYSGSAFSPGVRVNGELWLTKNWFADLMLGASSVSYSQSPTGSSGSSDAPGISTSTRVFGINAGYRYLTEGDIYGPQIFAKVGYQSFTWSTPIQASGLLSSKSYGGLDLGFGGTLPITSRDWGVMLNVNVLLFPSLSEEETYKILGDNASASGTTFFIGGYHYFSPRIALRAGGQVEIFSADNSSSGATTSQKTFGLLTSILYYF